jgi:hypothetical protein
MALASVLRGGVPARVGHMRARSAGTSKAIPPDFQRNLRHVGNSARDVGNWAYRPAREVGPMSEQAPSPALPPASPAAMSRLNPSALAVADAARVLSRLGGTAVTEAMLRADIDAGAPANVDGSLNLVHYAAWLVKEMATGGD